MEDQRPKSIRTIGLVVTIFAGFITFSNFMGALMFSIIGMGSSMNDQAGSGNNSTDPIAFLFNHYLTLCIIMVTIGIIYLLGGINIRRYKLWANRLVTYISALLIVLIWGLMITFSIMAAQQEEMGIVITGSILNAIFWSTPIGLLIRFLNKETIIKHFA
jgi:hypothetical protein